MRTILDELLAWATLAATVVLMALATATYVVCVALPVRVWRWLADRTWLLHRDG